MSDKKKMYKKKYGDTGFKKFMIFFFSMFIFLIVAYPEHIVSDTGAFFGILFSIFMITICIIDLIFTKYEDTVMILSEWIKPNDYITNCVFYDNKTGNSIGFACTKKLAFDLVVNQTYKVVVSRSGSKVMIFDILEPVNNETSAIEINNSLHEQIVSLMEYNEKQKERVETVEKIEDTAIAVTSIINIIKSSVGFLIGIFFITMGLFNSANTETTILSLMFGGLLIFISIANFFQQK